MELVFSILGGAVLLAGIIGCVLPIIPGPPLVYLSLIFVSIGSGWEAVSPAVLIVTGILAAVITVLDYVLPAMVSRRHGAGRAGTWGSLIGMIAGIIVFPPFGIFIGAFGGAVIGELIAKGGTRESIRAGWGVFLGIVFAIGIKLAFAGYIAILYIGAVLR